MKPSSVSGIIYGDHEGEVYDILMKNRQTGEVRALTKEALSVLAEQELELRRFEENRLRMKNPRYRGVPGP